MADTSPPTGPSDRAGQINQLAEQAQLIAFTIGLVARSVRDDGLPDLSDLISVLHDVVRETQQSYGALIGRWVDPDPPEWFPSALGAVPAVIRLAQQVVAAAAAAQTLPGKRGLRAAIQKRRADCSAFIAPLLAGYDRERVIGDVVRSANRKNGGDGVRVFGWSDGGQLVDLIEAYESLPQGYADSPPGTLETNSTPAAADPPPGVPAPPTSASSHAPT